MEEYRVHGATWAKVCVNFFDSASTQWIVCYLYSLSSVSFHCVTLRRDKNKHPETRVLI